MNKNLILALCFLLILILSSCIKPPKDVKEINIINLSKDMLDEINKNRDNPEKQLKFFRDFQTKFKAVVVFDKDTSIFVNSQKAPADTDGIFAYTLDNNQFIIVKPVYITFEGRNFLFSFDNKTWYLDKSDPFEKSEGIKRDYNVVSRVEEKKIFIDYWMTYSPGRAPKTMDISGKKKTVVTLKKGMIFAHNNEKTITDDLSKKILYIPEGTILSWTVNIDGNFIKSQLNENGSYIKSLTDMYIYFHNKMFSLSFDKKNWGVNILSFNIEPQFEVKSIEDNQIIFDISVNINYEKDKINLSLIKLLLENY